MLAARRYGDDQVRFGGAMGGHAASQIVRRGSILQALDGLLALISAYCHGSGYGVFAEMT